MSKDYYEILGVDRDVTPDELKKKFRKKAAENHPDKGGDHQAMAELNHAYEVLIDPKRKLLYDSTGQDSEKPIEVKVKNFILSAFVDALTSDAPNTLAHAKKFVLNKKDEVTAAKKHALTMRNKFQKKRDKIKSKGENVFHMIIDQNLANIEQEVSKMDSDLKLCELTLAKLKDYSSDETEFPEITRNIMMFYNPGA